MSEARNLRKTTYRLYPTPKQTVALDALLRSHQQLYNAALEERISAWSKAGKSISYADQCKSLTVLRRDLPEWADAANCSSQQMTLRRLDKAFGAFFRRVRAGQTPGFPRFKSLGRFCRFQFQKPWRRLALHTRRRLEAWQSASVGRGANPCPWPGPPGRRYSSQ